MSSPDQTTVRGKSRLALLLALVATLAITLPLGWMWNASRMPETFSVMDMGVHEAGLDGVAGVVGGAGAGGHGPTHGLPGTSTTKVSVDDLVEQEGGTPDVSLRLVAASGRITIAPGVTVQGITLNGTSPGPTIRATEGDIVEVTLVNESVPGGTTLHWHGLDVPNAEDGVAGVTQDAVHSGQSRTYRFVARQVGTYWYHSHQVSHEQVRKGLLGALVITPKASSTPAATPVTATASAADVVALSHTYGGKRTINGKVGEQHVDAAAGDRVRVRVINTDAGVAPLWVSGAAYVVAAIDGTDVNAPAEVEGKALVVPAGGRADVVVEVPTSGAVRVELSGASLVVGPPGSTTPWTSRPKDDVDLLTYGTPTSLAFDPDQPDRRFTYSIGRRPGFVKGRPGVHWSINGKLYPNIPMYVVSEGDVVRMEITNRSNETHPMHLHGHHLLVLARDGKPATGSPWWTDSLEVPVGSSFDVAFVADNPGIWMDHCHNLPHAREGLIAHLMYDGVTTPYRIGGSTPNEPE
ncbi:multicopper oxidase family protein [Knoellia locipacati]|uniref:multicopper oxidase family protein n=1 Tax=Knoellia locipacati TaxID=882824 RepID=UPI00384BBECA